jgi:hypothetical protein
MTVRGSYHRPTAHDVRTRAASTSRYAMYFQRNADRASGCGIRLRRLCFGAPMVPFGSVVAARAHVVVACVKTGRGLCARCSMLLHASTACTSSVSSSIRARRVRLRLRPKRRTSLHNLRKLSPRLWVAPWTSVVPSPALSFRPVIPGLLRGIRVACALVGSRGVNFSVRAKKSSPKVRRSNYQVTCWAAEA